MEEKSSQQRQSLVKKYDIPIEHLSFDYVNSCKEVKKLEKIVKILRSGEEGYYPELQSVAEEKLRALNPNSRQLRTETPVLTRSTMSKDEWNNVSADLASWQTEASLKDMRISEESNNVVDEDDSLPPIRQPRIIDKEANEVVKQKAKPVSKTDYAAWDRYDPDTELLKMELQEERERERKEKAAQQQEGLQNTQNRLESVVREAEKLSNAEREILAEKEKDMGNDYYKANDIKSAIEHYTASIAIWPTAKAYNNRSNCRLIQCEYSEALDDADKTLELEPDNVKALFRRAQALRHQNRFCEALDDINKILKREPANVLCKNIAIKLRELVRTQNNKSSVKIVRNDSNKGLSKSKNPVDTLKHFSDTNPVTRGARIVELPDTDETWKQKHCYEAPKYRQSTSSGPRIVELTDNTSPPQHSRSTRMNIIEVEKLIMGNINQQRRPVIVDKRSNRTMNNINNMMVNGEPRPGCSFWM